MLIKAGVDISRLERNTRRSLNIVNKLFEIAGKELTITSTYDGSHSAGSLHYANQAYKIRVSLETSVKMVKDIRFSLGSDFDVIDEGDHIQIKYDPK